MPYNKIRKQNFTKKPNSIDFSFVYGGIKPGEKGVSRQNPNLELY